MEQEYKVSLEKIIEEFSLETVHLDGDAKDIFIFSAEVNRPGLQLNGHFEFYDNKRIQIIGLVEDSLIKSFDEEEKVERIDAFFATHPSAVILARSLEPEESMLVAAEKYGVPLLRTSDTTSTFMAGLISLLNVELAPRRTQHGVLVEVYGEGILLLGDSGVGKSEAAIELVKRGHRLIADDAVELRRVSNRTIVGSSPENIRHFIELRGIGIVNMRRIFGMGAVKMSEKVDMVIEIEPWQPEKNYDRMGLEENTTDILGIKVPYTCIPVKPGRNLAIIIEVAAMNNRQKKMGYNAAKELLTALGMES